MTLGQRIQQIRISFGLSQEEFGAKLGTSRQTVSKWELDLTVPEIEKIVKISRIFSVTTDSLLVDGITTFYEETEKFPCGVYKSDRLEIVETEKVALVYYSNSDNSVFGAKAYTGFEEKKTLRAVCEYSAVSGLTCYAFLNSENELVANDSRLPRLLGEKFDRSVTKALYRAERFYVRHDSTGLNTVSEVGIKRCLSQWRMANIMSIEHEVFYISLCTGITEYVFKICKTDTDIYCGISYNIPIEFGLFSGGQFFRIRSYKDNSEPFCSTVCNLGTRYQSVEIPTEECLSGQCVNTSKGLFWGVKKYDDDLIVLHGCGDDEYIYSRKDRADERFCV